jgi:hypothetical protein
MLAVAQEEFAHHLSAATTLLVKIDFTRLHAENAKLSRPVPDADLRQNVVYQIGVQRVARRKMSQILF